MNLPKSKLTKSQKITMSKVKGNEKLVVTIRHDDECGNGHNSFSVTGTLFEKLNNGQWRDYSCGMLHDEVARFFPELIPYLKWHLCSTDGPMHYIANTMYHANDKDCHGLRKEEIKQIKNGKTGLPCWKLKVVDDKGNEVSRRNIEEYADAEECPTVAYKYEYRPFCRIGEGKTPDLEAARSCAVWPDATLEQLQDKGALLARLPGLMEEFKTAVESLGLIY